MEDGKFVIVGHHRQISNFGQSGKTADGEWNTAKETLAGLLNVKDREGRTDDGDSAIGVLRGDRGCIFTGNEASGAYGQPV